MVPRVDLLMADVLRKLLMPINCDVFSRVIRNVSVLARKNKIQSRSSRRPIQIIEALILNS